MEACKNCGTVCADNTLAMWNKITGYHPSVGYSKPGKNNGKLIPETSQLQGYLCKRCMKSLSAYKIKKEHVVQSRQKKEKIVPLNLWDAFH